MNTKESRWDPPPTGFVSIEEQERLDSKEKTKQYKKAKVAQDKISVEDPLNISDHKSKSL